MYQYSKLFSVISYITWIGWLIAFIGRDKRDMLVRQHLNQALVLNIASTIANILVGFRGILGMAGSIINLAILILFIMGLVRAFKMNSEPLPIIGGITLL